MKRKIFTLLMALFSVIAIQAQVRYVTENGEGDGTSWEAASNDIQLMMNELTESGGGEVWVKKGIYKPMHKAAEQYTDETPTTERDKAFILRTNVKLYGGFAGNEANRSERDWELNETILDGALNETDSVYHVVIAVKSENITLDGFTIRNGRAINSYQEPVPTDENHPFNKSVMIYGTWNNKEFKVPHSNGAGLYYWDVYPITLANLIIKDNVAVTNGGGVLGAYSVPSKLTNIIVENNHVLAGQTGGFYSNWGATEVTDMIIRDNSATANYGGGYFGGENQQIKNLTVENNIAGGIGGGVAFGSTKSIQINGLTVTGNKAGGSAGGAYFMNVNNADAGGTLVKNASFRLNKAEKAGGGFMVNIATLIRFENIIVEENESEKNSGGIEIVNRNTNLKIINSIIKGNTAKTYAAGIGISGNAAPNSQISIINTLIEGNQIIEGTSKFSSAIYRPAKSDLLELVLTNVTIANNTTVVSNGVGGIEDHANTTIQNSIIWGNTNGSNTPSNINATTLSTINHSLIEGYDLTSMNGLDASLIDAKQVFIDYENENYKLLPWKSNPVVDAGDNSFITDMVKDISGNSRFEGTVDLGAYEAQNVYNPFTGGTINEAGEREFTYTGSPVALTFHANTGATTADYTWTETSGTGETGTSGLPTEAGEYTITAKLADGTYPGAVAQTEIKISKAELPITFDAISDMIASVTPPQTLSATNTAGLTLEYESSDPSVASVSGSSLTAEGVGTAEITVRLASDDRNYYATPVVRNVHVQGPEVADATLLGIRVDGKDAVKNENGDYVINVASSVTSVNIEAIASSSLATTDGDINTQSVLPGENEFTISVTPQTGSAAEYKLHVYVQNGDASVAALTVNGKQATEESPGIYTISVTYTTEATVVVTPTDDLATVGGITTTQLAVRKGENIQDFTITAEDGTKATYQLTINVLNNNAYMSGITVDGTAANEDGMNYSITLTNTTSTDIVVTPLDPNAMVNGQQRVQTVNPGNNTFTYTVTSEDGEVENTYTLTVYVSKNDASLNSVLVGGRPATFNSGTNTYTVTLPLGTTTTEIVVTPNDANATVSGEGIKTVKTGENTFTIRVMAEDGTEVSYTVIIKVEDSSPSDPDPVPVQPVVTITGQLPEGVTIEPGLGEHTVREGQSLTLTINLGDQYDGMYVFLKIDDEYIPLEPVLRSSVYTYTIENIRENMTIGIHISQSPDPNPDPVDNVTIEGGAQLWTADGYLYIQISGAANVSVVSMAGRIVTSQKISAGEASISLTKGIYMVKVDNNVTKIIVR